MLNMMVRPNAMSPIWSRLLLSRLERSTFVSSATNFDSSSRSAGVIGTPWFTC